MDINQSYKTLNVPESATNEAVSRAFKQLAHKLHPDKNRDRIDWANEMMTGLNVAYSNIMSYRFQMEKVEAESVINKNNGPPPVKNKTKKETPGKDRQRPEKKRDRDPGPYDYYADVDNDEYLISRFSKLKDTANDSLYKFFQYSINNFVKRDNPVNTGIFNRVVLNLRQSYHAIKKMIDETDNPELREHFDVFSRMIFDFYRASECLNIIDSYMNPLDVDAFRLYKYGDEALHKAHREIFYDRHNRGSFRHSIADSNLVEGIRIFRITMSGYPKSSWIVETRIKLEYAISLKRYLDLFFNE